MTNTIGATPEERELDCDWLRSLRKRRRWQFTANDCDCFERIADELSDRAKLREAIRQMLIEAHETIPPDGKDAAFSALRAIARIGCAALNTTKGQSAAP